MKNKSLLIGFFAVISALIVGVTQFSTTTAKAQAMCNYDSIYQHDDMYNTDNYSDYTDITTLSSSRSLVAGTMLRTRVAGGLLGYDNQGTSGHNVICNITGRGGILTNAHVALNERGNASTLYVGGFFNNDRVGQAVRSVRCSELAQQRDAAFVEFATQSNWHLTTEAHGLLHNRVRLGRRSQLRNGARIVKFGARTGRRSEGVIRNHIWRDYHLWFSRVTAASAQLMRTQIELYNWDVEPSAGDSGSPIYLIGDSGYYYLIGMLWGKAGYVWGPNSNPLAHCIHDIIYDLNITPYCIDIHNLDFRIVDNEAWVTGITAGRQNVTDIRIPDYYRGRPVTRIGNNAFLHRADLREVRLGRHIRSIEFRAFTGTGITDIYIPSSVEQLGTGAFLSSQLTSVTFGANSRLSTIEMSVFYNTPLTNIRIPNGVTSIGTNAFARTHLPNLVLPSSVAAVGSNAFGEARNNFRISWHYNPSLSGAENILPHLDEIIIPNQITGIPSDAFRDSPLTMVRFVDINSSQLRAIGDRAFENTSISEITIPARVTSIGNNAFSGTDNLREITVAQGNAFYMSYHGILYRRNPMTFVHVPYALSGTVSLPHGITAIPPDAFARNTERLRLILPASVNAVAADAFGAARNNFVIVWHYNSALNGRVHILPHLEEVIIPNTITHIPAGEFMNAARLMFVTFAWNSRVESIGQNAFYNTALWNAHHSGTVVYAGNWVVGMIWNRGVTGELVLRENTVGIADGAFTNPQIFTSVVIPYSVRYIGNHAFAGVQIQTLTVKRSAASGITRLGNGAMPSGGSFGSFGLIIYVPDAVSLATYSAAPNWSAHASAMRVAGSNPSEFTVNIINAETYCCPIHLMMPGHFMPPLLFNIAAFRFGMPIGTTQIIVQPNTSATVRIEYVYFYIFYFDYNVFIPANGSGVSFTASGYARPQDLP